GKERRRPSNARNHHRNSDRIQQNGQQHVARAGAHEHRREQGPDRCEADGASEQERDEKERPLEECSLKQQRYDGHDQKFSNGQQYDYAEQLADVDRRTRSRRQKKRAQSIAVALALERAAERERSSKRDRDPQDACGGVLERLPFGNEPEREDKNARDGEKQRCVENLATPDLDR